MKNKLQGGRYLGICPLFYDVNENKAKRDYVKKC